MRANKGKNNNEVINKENKTKACEQIRKITTIKEQTKRQGSEALKLIIYAKKAKVGERKRHVLAAWLTSEQDKLISIEMHPSCILNFKVQTSTKRWPVCQ